jgi:hypothetical protein
MFLLLTVKILVLAIKCWPFESGIIWRILVVENLMERVNSPSCLNLPFPLATVSGNGHLLVSERAWFASASLGYKFPWPVIATSFWDEELPSPPDRELRPFRLSIFVAFSNCIWPRRPGQTILSRPHPAWNNSAYKIPIPPTRALDCLASSAGQVEESSVDRTSSRMGRGKCCWTLLAWQHSIVNTLTCRKKGGGWAGQLTYLTLS